MAIIPPVGGVRLTGVAFALSFTLALTIGLGDLLGAFADRADSFPAYFDVASGRLRHVVGAYAATGSGLVFLGFAAGFQALRSGDGRGLLEDMVLVTSGTFAASLGLAAASLSTVSLSVAFGKMTGDLGIAEAQHLLPQLGYVVLTVPAALAGGLAVWLLAVLGAKNGLLPRWVGAIGRATGLAQLFGFSLLPLILLAVWTLIAALNLKAPKERELPNL